MNGARHHVDFERTIALRPFVRKKPRTDWLHHPEPPRLPVRLLGLAVSNFALAPTAPRQLSLDLPES